MKSFIRAALAGAPVFALALPIGHDSALAQTAAAEALPPVVIEQKSAAPKKAPAAPAKSAKKSAVAKPAPEAAPPAPAQDVSGATDEASEASGKVQAGDRSGSLGVPTAAEAKAEIERTPGGVDVVPAEEYAKSTPAVTLKDALDYVPGVFVQPKWGEDSRLSIRGSGLSRNFHGRGVQLLVDGIIPITTADGDGDFQEIDPTAYRYIEVYKGGNALRFGANALGGAINFVMPTGYDADLFGARLDVGSFGLHKLAASSGGVSGAVDYFINTTWQEQDGFRDHSGGESVRGAANIGFRVTEDIETRFYFNANHVRQRIPGAVTKDEALTNPEGAFVRPGDGPLPFFPFSVGNDNVDRNYQRNVDSERYANRTTVRLAPGTTVEFGGFYLDKHLDHPILFVLDNKTEDYGGFARLVDDSAIGGFRNRFIAGVGAHDGETHSHLFQSVLGEKGFLISDADQKSENTTVYAENSFFVLPTVALVAGVSYVDTTREQKDRLLADGDQSGEATVDFWNPKAGVVWDATPSAQVFANVSRSGEAPTFNEITITSLDITSLRHQEATTYEIGTRGATPNFLWDLALYRAEIENEFQCLDIPDSGFCAQINLDKTVHQGVELGFGAAVFSALFEPGANPDKVWFNAAYTFSDFFFDNDAVFGDNELPGAPRHFVRAELLYKHPLGYYAGPNVEWVPEGYYADSANTLSTDAYALLGAKAGFDNGGPLSLYVEARNLSDEAYISSAEIAARANAASTLFEPGTGRAVYGGMQVKW